jgi:hypothetical protein
VNKRTKERTIAYICNSAARRRSDCHQWSIAEAAILPDVIKALVDEVDHAILEASNPKPPEETGDDLASVNAQLAELASDLLLAEERRMKARSDAEYERQSAVIMKWEERQAELERRKANLAVVEGDVARFAKWWQGIRGDLVQVIPAVVELGSEAHHAAPIGISGELAHIPPQSVRREMGKQLGGEPQLINVTMPGLSRDVPDIRVTRAGVVMESTRFRNLLKTLGIKVTIWWTPKIVTDKTGKPRRSDKFEVDRFEITIDGKTLAESPRRSGNAPGAAPTPRIASRR